LLEVEELHVSYKGAEAVRGISLEVMPGEIVGMVGPNGAGKTSTLSAIVGLVRPAAGAIRLGDIELAGRPPEDIARLGIAFVPEGRHIFQSLSVAENLSLGNAARPGAGDAGALERWLERFPVLRRLYRAPAGRLSGGEQQQLAIARALLSSPRVLLMDEPSLGLAPKMVDLVFDVLAELRAAAVTVLLVEQQATRTLAFADRSYVMSLGRVVLSGTREALAERDDIAHIYLHAPAVAP
jgi:branched-chain amino acid transport system ATP-binding protein